MGGMCRRRIWHLLCFLTLAITILMLCSTFISLSYGSNSDLSTFSNQADSFAGRQQAFQSTENRLFYTALSAQLALQEVKPAQKIALRSSNRHNSLEFVHSAQILSLTGMLFFMQYCVGIIGKRNKPIAVIAYFIGGHAPPSAQA